MNRRWFLAAAAVTWWSAACWRTGYSSAGNRVGRKTNWRGLVADYMSLYVPQTLEHLPRSRSRPTHATADHKYAPGPEPHARATTLPRPEFKRAQILEYDGVAITQITYLDRSTARWRCASPPTTAAGFAGNAGME